MSTIERYLDLLAAFRESREAVRTMAFQLADMARELERRVDQPAPETGLPLPDSAAIADAVERRATAWQALNQAWDAIPPARREGLSAPSPYNPPTSVNRPSSS